MIYCKDCASRYGWQFVTNKPPISLRAICQVCYHSDYQDCTNTPISSLRCPGGEPMDRIHALHPVVEWCGQRLKDAHHKLILAVGDKAAQEARIEAIKKEGWKERHMVGRDIKTELKEMDVAITLARIQWQLAFYCYKEIWTVVYGDKE